LRYLILVFLLFNTTYLFAQQKNKGNTKPTKIAPKDNTIKLLMVHEESYGAGLNTNGFSVMYNKTRVINFTKKRFWEIEFSKIKSEREIKTEPTFTIENYPAPKNYVLGKRNSLFVFEYRKGYNYKLTQKTSNDGVEISINTSIGGTLGLLKPYYLQLVRLNKENQTEITEEKYSNKNDSVFLNYAQNAGIYGYSGFTKGIFESIPVPAFNARIGLNFDWAAYDENISSLEIGFKANIFLTTLPLMANQHNHQIYPSLFVVYKIGSRKY
jgi:hypothetical protein